jgi:adenylate kinase
MLNIALFGPPCSGKGTQASLLVEKFDFVHISTGDILRKEIALKTTLGKEVQAIIDKGCLVEDDLMVQIIEQYIKASHITQGILFDGFPRTEIQCLKLECLLTKLDTELDSMIFLDVPENELRSRMLNRAKVSERSDDTLTIINKRMEEYREKTLPVMQFYDEQKKVIHIDGNQTIEKIFAQLSAIIISLKQQKEL